MNEWLKKHLGDAYYAVVWGLPVILAVSLYLYSTPYKSAGELEAAKAAHALAYTLEAPTGAATRCQSRGFCRRLQ